MISQCGFNLKHTFMSLLAIHVKRLLKSSACFKTRLFLLGIREFFPKSGFFLGGGHAEQFDLKEIKRP